MQRVVCGGQVERDKNHASIIMWSLGNEVIAAADRRGNKKFSDLLPGIEDQNLAVTVCYVPN